MDYEYVHTFVNGVVSRVKSRWSGQTFLFGKAVIAEDLQRPSLFTF